MRTPLLGFAIALLVAACGGSAPTVPNNNPPPPIGSTNVRIVDTLDNNRPIGGASVSSVTLQAATSNPEGYLTLQAATASSHNIRVSAPSWVERVTLLKVPGEPTNISLMPSTISMSFFDEMCRGLGRVTRWRDAPALFVETSVLQYTNRVASSDSVPAGLVAATIDELRRTLPLLTANRFADFASIELRSTPAGGTSIVPGGAVGLTWQRTLADNFGAVAYGRRVPALDGWIATGEVALDYDWHALHLPAGSRTDYFNVVQHELGHALGYSHTKTSPSFMYEVFLMTVSGLDRQAFEIVMQRPSGNTTPDSDPGGITLNFIAEGPEMITPRCAFLRR